MEIFSTKKFGKRSSIKTTSVVCSSISRVFVSFVVVVVLVLVVVVLLVLACFKLVFGSKQYMSSADKTLSCLRRDFT